MKKVEDTISLDVFRNSGKKGGLSTAKRGRNFYVEIGKLGNLKRWDNSKNQINTNGSESEKSVK